MCRSNGQRPPLVVMLSVLSLGLLAFAVVKAARVSFSYDETWTYLQHVRKGVLFQPPGPGMMGNHHLLNVWGMILARTLFGESELALRSPNLLAYAGYLYATVRIVLRARTGLLAVACWVLLNAHPYLIDFFCVARGYGIGSGAVMLSLWSMTRSFTERGHLRHLAGAVAWAAIAAMANLILLNFLLAMAGVFAVRLTRRMIAQGSRPWRSQMLILLAIAFGGVVAVLPNALAMLRSGPLGFGCPTFWSCSLDSLGRHLLYGHLPWITPVELIKTSVAIIALIIFLVSVHNWRLGSLGETVPAWAGLSVLILYISGFFVQHWMMGAPFPEGRMSVALVPQAMFVLVSFLSGSSGPGWWAATVGGFLAVLAGVHWAWSLDTGRTNEWQGSADTRTLLSTIAADRRAAVPARPVVLVGTDFDVSGSVGYYVHTRDWHWLLVRDHVPPDSFPPCDYYIVSDASMSVVDPVHWSLLYTSAISGQRVYRDERYAAWRGELLHHGASRADRYIQAPLPRLEWTLPEGLKAGAGDLITGSTQSLEVDVDNWLTLTLDVQRAGRTIAHADAGSHRQIRTHGNWADVHVELPLREPLLPGDVIVFAVMPADPERGAIFVGSMDLRISR